jgi:hypothetical protein
MNIKEDFLYHIEGKSVLAAIISLRGYAYELCKNNNNDSIDLDIKHLILNKNWKKEEYDKFLDEIDFNSKGQDINGTIWFTNNTWSELLYDYDELVWRYNSCPEMPEIVKNGI